MFGWWFGRSERAYQDGLAALRSVIASQLEHIEALAGENGKLRATVDMMLKDMAAIKAGQTPPSIAPAAPPSSPLLDKLAQMPSRSGPVAVPDPPAKPKAPDSPPPRPRPFGNMATSGGHIRAQQAVKATKGDKP